MYYVYMLASAKHGTLYVGVTRDLIKRIYEHKTKAVKGFTSRHEVDRLVWFEQHGEIVEAIAHEKRLKKWRREWKIQLIEEGNPD
jgi:putative endonuclease